MLATEVVASVAVNVTGVDWPARVEPFAGAVMVTAGLIVSTVKVAVAVPVPEALVAVTDNRVSALAQTGVACGLVQCGCCRCVELAGDASSASWSR